MDARDIAAAVLATPTEFGAKVLLNEVDGGLVTRYVILEGNPPDAPQLPANLDQARRRVRRVAGLEHLDAPARGRPAGTATWP